MRSCWLLDNRRGGKLVAHVMLGGRGAHRYTVPLLKVYKIHVLQVLDSDELDSTPF